MSNALPYSMSIPQARLNRPALSPAPLPPWSICPPKGRPMAPAEAPTEKRLTPTPPRPRPPAFPMSMSERMVRARERLCSAAKSGHRIRAYEVALELDLSEFHFARQFRLAFGCSPHGYYDEVRAEQAREMLRDGLPESDVARRIGLRRPAELRALLTKTTLGLNP